MQEWIKWLWLYTTHQWRPMGIQSI